MSFSDSNLSQSDDFKKILQFWEKEKGISIEKPFDFLKGMSDCAKGLPAKSTECNYLRGYATEYQHEQNLTNITERR